MTVMFWRRLQWVGVAIMFLLAMPSSSLAGVILDYEGMDWMIREADEIVIATGKPPEERKFRADGSPIFSGGSIYMNGAFKEVTIQQVLKGCLKDGETTSIYIPYFEYTSGSVELEFPMSASGGLYGPEHGTSMLLFMKRTGNTTSLETIPSFGSQLQVDKTKMHDEMSSVSLRSRILNLIDRNAPALYEQPKRSNFVYKKNVP